MEISNDIASKIMERLWEWEEKGGQLPGYIQFYQELLKIQGGVPCGVIVQKPNLTSGAVQDRLRQGIPLLLFEDFQPDWQQVQKTFEQVAAWLVKDCSSPLSEAETFKNISHNLALLKAIIEAWYRQHPLADIQAAEGVDQDILASVVLTTLKPFLFAYSRHLLPEVDHDLWYRKYCPVCGGKPDFSYLARERGARWLVCSRCDGEWLSLRLACPYCGTQNQDVLSYFTDEQDSGVYRLYVCEQCHTYIKTIDLRQAQPDILLPLERLMTLEMDKQALEKGYRPGWNYVAEPVRLTS